MMKINVISALMHFFFFNNHRFSTRIEEDEFTDFLFFSKELGKLFSIYYNWNFHISARKSVGNCVLPTGNIEN